MSIYNDKLPPMCLYCARGKEGPMDHILCAIHGPVSYDYHCKKYQYDPRKRIPPKKRRNLPEDFTAEDFTI